MSRESTEHRGHKLVERESPGGHIYTLPESFAELSISECIRRLALEDWSRWEIHQVTGIRYQHVRNVLEQTAHRSGRGHSLHVKPDAEMPETGDCTKNKSRTIADVLNEARTEIAILAGVSEDLVQLNLRIET